MAEMISGAEAFMRVLREEHIDTLFGYIGASIVPIYDQLYASDQVRCIMPRHEQGAAHMADGYARATGRVGVAMATSGPGACNLVTGLATAYMDSIPMVAITGQVKTHLVGTDAFQEADLTGITLPITKHSYLVKEPAEVARFADILREAFYLARSGRPGPVLMDIPFDISAGQVPWTERDLSALDGYEEPSLPDGAEIDGAAQMIAAAQRPVLMIGGGIVHSGASDEVRELAERCSLPVVHTLMAKGCFPESHPLSLGMPGMHGAACASWALHRADLIVAVACRFDDRITGDLSRFAPEAAIVHIDIDPAEIGKVREAAVGIASDAKPALRALIDATAPRGRDGWHAQLDGYREAHPLRYADEGELPAPQAVVEALHEVTGGEAIVATDVGQHQMFAAHYYPLERPRRWLTSGGLGTMGYGLPAAIGAQVARPDELVIGISGDGSIQMCMQELTTAAVQRLPVKVFVLNNGYLGMVRQWQELFYDRRYSGVTLTGNPDFARLAEAHGATGLRCAGRAELRETIERALATDGPVLVDVPIAAEENVYPFIPAGRSVDELMECEV